MVKNSNGPASVSNKPWIHLEADEKILWSSHPVIYPYIPHYLAGLILIGIGIWIQFFMGDLNINGFALSMVSEKIPNFIPIGSMVAGTAYVGYIYLVRTNTYYVITSKHLYSKRGILTVDPKHTKVVNVQNIDPYQSIINNLLGYGSVNVETAGTGDIDMRLNNVPRVNTFVSILTQQSSKEEPSPTDEPREA